MEEINYPTPNLNAFLDCWNELSKKSRLNPENINAAEYAIDGNANNFEDHEDIKNNLLSIDRNELLKEMIFRILEVSKRLVQQGAKTTSNDSINYLIGFVSKQEHISDDALTTLTIQRILAIIKGAARTNNSEKLKDLYEILSNGFDIPITEKISNGEEGRPGNALFSCIELLLLNNIVLEGEEIVPGR